MCNKFNHFLVNDFWNSGYMAPEYISHGYYSVKSDVFSFGILVLEIVSGRKKSWLCNTDDVELLLSYVSVSVIFHEAELLFMRVLFF